MKTKNDHDTVVDSPSINSAPATPLEFGELIYAYSRAQAIADGVLVDVSERARETGFRIPVAMTSAVWETCVRVPDGAAGQDEIGRLWDVLSVLAFAVRRTPADATEIRFTIVVRQSDELTVNVPLKALCGPGDQAEPVITILLPDED